MSKELTDAEWEYVEQIIASLVEGILTTGKKANLSPNGRSFLVMALGIMGAAFPITLSHVGAINPEKATAISNRILKPLDKHFGETPQKE